MNNKSENWLKIARYDLRAAEVAFQNKLYLKVYESSHNALEKLLKGIISSHGEQPAKIHDLMRLMSQARIENLQSDIKEILDELNTLYYSTRYPEDFDSLDSDISEDKTALVLKETRRIFSWLEKKLN